MFFVQSQLYLQTNTNEHKIKSSDFCLFYLSKIRVHLCLKLSFSFVLFRGCSRLDRFQIFTHQRQIAFSKIFRRFDERDLAFVHQTDSRSQNKRFVQIVRNENRRFA